MATDHLDRPSTFIIDDQAGLAPEARFAVKTIGTGRETLSRHKITIVAVREHGTDKFCVSCTAYHLT